MNALIGTAKEVKLILLSLDDDTKEPTKQDVKRFFPDSQINIYKANGRHREHFWDLEKIVDISRNGAENHGNFRGKVMVTHAIKLDSNASMNEFFILSYADSIIEKLIVSQSCLDKAGALIRAIARANQEIESITLCEERFNSVRTFLTNMGLADPKVENPNHDAIKLIFEDYGVSARSQMTEFSRKWLGKRQWN